MMCTSLTVPFERGYIQRQPKSFIAGFEKSQGTSIVFMAGFLRGKNKHPMLVLIFDGHQAKADLYQLQ